MLSFVYAVVPCLLAVTEDAVDPRFTIPFLQLYVFMLAGFVGYQVITRVPALLHTPLMSATNAISGISLVGSLVAAGGKFGAASTFLGFVAVTAATINVVGGFMITDRMLKMFKRDERK
jgi:H+-translocating NAD(P) transhydrogenase subunit alpha